MSQLPTFFIARELFAHQRILVFWLVAPIALAAPWLWLSLPEQESVTDGVGTPIADERHKPHFPAEAS